MSLMNDYRRYGTDQEREEWDREVAWEYRREDRYDEPCCNCGNCKWYAFNEDTEENFCNNEYSEYFGENTNYGFSECGEWSEE